MPAEIIDGQKIAATLRATLGARIGALKGRKPGLAVVLVGEDPASRVYVRNKIKACLETGIENLEHHLPAHTSEADLLALVKSLNENPAIDGILVQLPLPPHIDERRVTQAVDPDKDVDGFHPINAGRLMSNLPGFVPCTPLGCMHLIKTVAADIAGAKALVIGRSLTVGKPVALLLSAANATVTLAHSKTRNLAGECAEADILVAAIGRPQMVKGAWVKPGAIVIDVGINRTEAGTLVGDVEFAEAVKHARAITPVPRGVGPMTIAYLIANTFLSYEQRVGSLAA